MSYLIENSAGNILGHAGTLDEAIETAKKLLENDPEQSELTIACYTVERTVTYGPDANWDTTIVVLKPGERIQPPHTPFDQAWLALRPDEEIETGYDLSDPKHHSYHERMSAAWDERDIFGGRIP